MQHHFNHLVDLVGRLEDQVIMQHYEEKEVRGSVPFGALLFV